MQILKTIAALKSNGIILFPKHYFDCNNIIANSFKIEINRIIANFTFKLVHYFLQS